MTPLQRQMMSIMGYETLKEMVEDIYIKQGMSLRTINKKIGVSSMAWRNWMIEVGIKARPRGGANHKMHSDSVHAKLMEADWEKLAQMTSQEIAVVYRVTARYITTVASQYGIPYKKRGYRK